MPTELQKKVLAWMRTEASRGQVPTVRELAAYMGRSVGAAHGIMRRLVKSGALTKVSLPSQRGSRSYRVADGRKFGAIRVYREGAVDNGPAAPELIVVDAGAFHQKSTDGLIGVRCEFDYSAVSKSKKTFHASAGDVLVMKAGYPGKRENSAVAIIQSGKWALGKFKGVLRGGVVQLKPSDEGWIKVSFGGKQVRGYMIGIIGQRT